MPLTFTAGLYQIAGSTLVVLPLDVSSQLPSRGMVMVKGTVNGAPFGLPLEPDGRGSHWFRLNNSLQQAAQAAAADTVTVTLEPTKDWPEPTLPADLHGALAADSQAHQLWQGITPMARWDWLRWIGSTASDETRERRINNALSMLKSGKRRPCCFNRTLCTEPQVSKNGVLNLP